MAFVAGNRVKVTDESSQYRHHYGTVEAILAGTGPTVQVRLDGDAVLGREDFYANQLSGTSLACPLTYPS